MSMPLDSNMSMNLAICILFMSFDMEVNEFFHVLIASVASVYFFAFIAPPISKQPYFETETAIWTGGCHRG